MSSTDLPQLEFVVGGEARGDGLAGVEAQKVVADVQLREVLVQAEALQDVGASRVPKVVVRQIERPERRGGERTVVSSTVHISVYILILTIYIIL